MMRTRSGTPVWVDGAGPSVVLVHGVLMDHRMWAAQVRDLAAAYRLVRLDMLGHGEAPDPPGKRALDDFVFQVHEVITTCCPGERPVLVGFSMGGLVAQAYALRHWRDLRGLVLLNAVYDRSAAERDVVAARSRMMLQRGVESVVESANERWFRPDERRDRAADVETIIGWLRAGNFAPKVKAHRVFSTADAETAGRLHEVRCPALVMTGDGDTGSTPAMAEKMAAELPDARLHVLDGQQHMMPVLDAARVDRILADFLAGLDEG